GRCSAVAIDDAPPFHATTVPPPFTKSSTARTSCSAELSAAAAPPRPPRPPAPPPRPPLPPRPPSPCEPNTIASKREFRLPARRSSGVMSVYLNPYVSNSHSVQPSSCTPGCDL